MIRSKNKAIINELVIVSGVLNSSYPKEIEAIKDEYFDTVTGSEATRLTKYINNLLKLCEANELYEACTQLVELKKNLK